MYGLLRESNPRPPAPETRIIPLDQAAKSTDYAIYNIHKQETIANKFPLYRYSIKFQY